MLIRIKKRWSQIYADTTIRTNIPKPRFLVYFYFNLRGRIMKNYLILKINIFVKKRGEIYVF